MWNQEALAIINALAAGLAREGRPERHAIRLFASPLSWDQAEVKRILATSAVYSVGDYPTAISAPVWNGLVMTA